jgi:hypothetical protein
MLRSFRSAVSLLLISLLLSLAAIASRTAWAHEGRSLTRSDPVVRLTKEEARIFRDALKAVATQAHVTLVAEGEPLKLTLPKEEVQDFPEGDVALPEIVAKLAAAFDYSAESQGNVFVLRKRYSDPRDLPGVTLQECALAVQDVMRVASALNPRVPPRRYGGTRHPLAGELIATLTPEQLQAMQDKELRVADLTPRLQAQVWRIALYYYVQYPMDDAERVLKRINQITKTDPVFCQKDAYGLQRLFGYEIAAGPQGRSLFLPLSHPNQVRTGSGWIQVMLPPAAKKAPTAPPSDPTDPLPSDATESTGITLENSTLETVTAALSARRDSPAKMVVDAALAAKPITVVGQDFTPSTQVLTALADAYGLRVKAEDDGTLRLTRRLFKVATNASDLPEAVRRVFPEPFLRALQGRKLAALTSQPPDEARPSDRQRAEQDGDETQPNPMSQEAVIAKRKKQEERLKQIQQIRNAPYALRNAAVQRLRTIIEPKLKAAPDARVAMSSLGEPERVALANVLMADCLQGIRQLVDQPVPEFIEQFNQTILTGGLRRGDDGKQKFSLFLSFKTPDGRVFQGPGFGNVDYVK